jgi:hypothetical protein
MNFRLSGTLSIALFAGASASASNFSDVLPNSTTSAASTTSTPGYDSCRELEGSHYDILCQHVSVHSSQEDIDKRIEQVKKCSDDTKHILQECTEMDPLARQYAEDLQVCDARYIKGLEKCKAAHKTAYDGACVRKSGEMYASCVYENVQRHFSILKSEGFSKRADNLYGFWSQFSTTTEKPPINDGAEGTASTSKKPLPNNNNSGEQTGTTSKSPSSKCEETVSGAERSSGSLFGPLLGLGLGLGFSTK